MELRRNQWGHLMVVPPSGGKPVGYPRATTVAKALDDGGALGPWKAAMAMRGMLRRDGLRAQVEVLEAQHPAKGPWYGGDESKAAIKKLVEQCIEAGGGSDRADVGTALHAIVEQINVGQDPVVSQDSTRADVDAYRKKIAAAGITFDPSTIEVTVVLDAWKVAGTADMGCAHVPGLGNVIADLKTGTDLTFSWRSIAVQLAIYAHGDAVYRQGDAKDGSQDQRLPMPEVRQDVAVVIHLPAGEARCDLYVVDIAAGWEAFDRSMWARRWRQRRDLVSPLAIPATPPATTGSPLVDGGGRELLLTAVRALPAEKQQLVKDSWPAGCPPLTREEGWTAERLATVSRLVLTVAEKSASEGAGDADTITAPASQPADGTGPAGESTPSEATAPPAALETPITPAEWGALTHDEQRRRILRGHLPVELRTPPEELDWLRTRLEALTVEQQAWVTAQARLVDLPNLGHPHRWTIDNGRELLTLLDTAEQLEVVPPVAPYDWPTLVAEVGVTKAATVRKAKELAAELGIEKVSPVIERLPADGPLAEQLVAWLLEQPRAAA